MYVECARLHVEASMIVLYYIVMYRDEVGCIDSRCLRYV